MIDTSSHAMQEILAEYLRNERLDKINEDFPPDSFKETIYTKYVKRVLDIVIVLPAILITLPLNAILALLTLIILGQPLLFAQERVGKNGKIFKLVKFRNMTNETDENGILLPPQQRLTKYGKIVRKTSLDELLNLWSILKGDMSIIGPRPLPPVYFRRYSDRHKGRLNVRPGLECPPREPIDHERSWNEQFENDLWYVRNISFKTDCYMLFRLVGFTFNRQNAKMRAQCEKGSFIGYSWDGRAISNLDLDEQMIKKIINSN